MGLVSNLSITKKLILITMGVSGPALLLSTVVNALPCPWQALCDEASA